MFRYVQLCASKRFNPIWKTRSCQTQSIHIMSRPKPLDGGAKRPPKRFKKAKKEDVAEGSHEDVLQVDVKRLAESLQDSKSLEGRPSAAEESLQSYPDKFSEVEVKILELSSTGDGLGTSTSSSHIYVVPFTVPGDIVTAKVIRHVKDAGHIITDFVEVLEASTQRNDTRIECKYFAKCSGCQLQMMSYEDQLAHKKTILERAYINFSGMIREAIPTVNDTIGSPMRYGYRTKLTPHFDGPPGMKRRQKSGSPPKFEEIPPIGFMQKGTRWTIDVEDCPIGTDAVRAGMREERARVAKEISNYRRGATLLLRESTERVLAVKGKGETSHVASDQNQHETGNTAHSDPQISTKASSSDPSTEIKTCITDSKATTTEYIGPYIFTNPAGAFFQNNNSILPNFTAYIRQHIASPTDSPSLTHLIDAYCGSGLFTITLSSLFTSSLGIDIASRSIDFARRNAALNGIPNAAFMTATASALFAEVEFDPKATAVVIDPPRKGCDADFLAQLLRFGPRRVVYVSCNVHTQARDVGFLVEGKQGTRYGLKSLQGFDFFPQTGHVEGVAVLEKAPGNYADGN